MDLCCVIITVFQVTQVVQVKVTAESRKRDATPPPHTDSNCHEHTKRAREKLVQASTWATKVTPLAFPRRFASDIMHRRWTFQKLVVNTQGGQWFQFSKLWFRSLDNIWRLSTPEPSWSASIWSVRIVFVYKKSDGWVSKSRGRCQQSFYPGPPEQPTNKSTSG